MMDNIRIVIGAAAIRFGMWIIPADTREMVRRLLLRHVPGALTHSEQVEAAEDAAAVRFVMRRKGVKI